MISLNSCREHKTRNPLEVYQLWSGNNNLPRGVHLIHGYYWQSAHWSKEYIMYLELKAPAFWRDQFIKQNNLVYKKDTTIGLEQDAPIWFTPTTTYKIFIPSGFNEGSVYYNDSVSDRMFIYEIQL
jgi:hypothetical protein